MYDNANSYVWKYFLKQILEEGTSVSERKKEDYLVEIIRDDAVQNCLAVCIFAWIVIINNSAWLTSKENFGILLFVIVVLLTVFVIIFFVFRVTRRIIMEYDFTSYEICRDCAQNTSKYEFASFDFYTLNQITDMEKKMGEDVHPTECLITIYTSSLDTEEDEESVRETVKSNLEKGVKYNIYYLRGIPTEKQLQTYGKNSLIKYKGKPTENIDLELAAEFDIIVFENSEGEREGYFSINFSTSVAPRPCAQGFVCENQCHYENENLLYKKMRKDSTNLLLYTLRQWRAEHIKDGKIGN